MRILPRGWRLAGVVVGVALGMGQTATPGGGGPGTAPAVDSGGYRLVWADEFEKDGPLDPKDWTFEEGFVRNEELQWYQPDNARCVGGKLVIEARREAKANPRYVEGSRDWKTNRKEAGYTSASATTRGLHGWLYGRFEIRARIDVRAGSWPAFWALGVRGGWPAGGEVDVMEYYAKTLLANVGWAGADGRITWDSVRTPLGRLGEKWAEEFHVWRMDWDERRIGLYVDGRLLNETDLATTLNRGKVGDNPFHRPMYLLLNQAIGGQGGDPGKTEFPVRFEIDYVRVYQQGAPAATRAAD